MILIFRRELRSCHKIKSPYLSVNNVYIKIWENWGNEKDELIYMLYIDGCCMEGDKSVF